MPRKRTEDRPELKPVNVGAAAIDIGSRMHMAAVNPVCTDVPGRSFGTFTQDLHDLADWFKACDVLAQNGTSTPFKVTDHPITIRINCKSAIRAKMAAASVQNVLMVIARLRWHARTCSSPRPNGEGPAAATPLKGSGLTEPFSMCRAIADAYRKLLKLWNLSTAKLKRRFRQNWAEMATNFETI